MDCSIPLLNIDEKIFEQVVSLNSSSVNITQEFPLYKVENLTNQIMEVLAAIVALNAVKNTVESIEVITDSMYVVGTMTKNWKRKANIKLWNKLDEIVNNLNLILQEPIKFTHTYGHANDEFNNIADKLADEASKEFIL